jgi:hypothetical protein
MSTAGDWLDLALELERLSFEKHEEANLAWLQGDRKKFSELGGYCNGLRDAAEKIRQRVVRKEMDNAR